MNKSKVSAVALAAVAMGAFAVPAAAQESGMQGAVLAASCDLSQYSLCAYTGANYTGTLVAVPTYVSRAELRGVWNFRSFISTTVFTGGNETAYNNRYSLTCAQAPKSADAPTRVPDVSAYADENGNTQQEVPATWLDTNKQNAWKFWTAANGEKRGIGVGCSASPGTPIFAQASAIAY